MLRDFIERWSEDYGMDIWTTEEGFSFSQFEGNSIEVPMVVLASERNLNSFIDEIEDADLKVLWPGVSRVETAFRLLGVHLVELIESRGNEPTIELTNSGFRFVQ